MKVPTSVQMCMYVWSMWHILTLWPLYGFTITASTFTPLSHSRWPCGWNSAGESACMGGAGDAHRIIFIMWWIVYTSAPQGSHLRLHVCNSLPQWILHAYEWLCVCVCAHVCGQSVCIMNSHRDSRAVVKGVSSSAHHTSLSHFQSDEALERRREALPSGSDKTSHCFTSTLPPSATSW